jgi:hypothetical protein
MTLDEAITALYVREINCGCETFWDGGIKVWIDFALEAERGCGCLSRDRRHARRDDRPMGCESIFSWRPPRGVILHQRPKA